VRHILTQAGLKPPLVHYAANAQAAAKAG